MPERVVDTFQSLFRRADNQGKRHQCQRKRTGYDRISPTQCIDEQRHTEQTEYDWRDSAQVICHDTDEADHFAVCRIFIHVDAAHDPDRETDDTASDDQVEGSDDRREDSSFRHSLFRCFRQEVPADHAASFDDDEA